MFTRLTGTLSRSTFILLLGISLSSCGVDEEESIQLAREHFDGQKYNAAVIELKNLLQANPSHAEGRYLLSKVSLVLGDIESAEKEVRRARESGWDMAQSELLRAVILLRMGENERVLEEIEIRDEYPEDIRAELTGLWAAAEIATDNIDGARDTLALAEQISSEAKWVLQGRIRMSVIDDNPGQADELVDRALELYPEEQDFWLLKASLKEEAGDTEAVNEALLKVLELDPRRVMTVRGRQAALGLVQNHIGAGDFEAAGEMLARVLGNFSKDPAANYYGALLDVQARDYDAAIEHLTLVLSAVESHRDSMLLMGNIYYSKGEFGQAAYYLEKATSSKPDDLGAQAMLGQTYLRLGQYRDAEERLDIVSRRVKGNPRISAMIGISRIQSGKTDAGIDALQSALEQEPGDIGIRQELAKAYMLSGDAEQAISSLNKLDDVNTGKSKALLLMAHMQAGNYAQAMKLAQQLKNEHPELGLSYNLSGSVYESMGDLVNARKDYDKAAELDESDMLALLNLGRLDTTEGEYDSAAMHFDKVLKDYPDNAAALIGMARLDMERGQQENALQWLEKARATNENNIEARVLLANYFISVRQADRAIEYVNELTDINEVDPRVLAVRAAAYVDAGHEDAAQAIKQLLDAHPNFAHAHYYDAKYKLGKDDRKGSKAALVRALELNPKYLEALLALGNLERLQGNIDAAIEQARILQTKHPRHSAGYLLESQAYLQAGDHERALAVLDKGMYVATQADVAIQMNKIYQSTGQQEEGRRVLESWIKDHPEDIAALFNLAVTHLAIGDNEDAIETYEKILEIKPDIPAVMNDLAWLYDLTGRTGGLEMARRANQLVPNNPAIQDTYGWLLVKSGRIANGLAMLEDAAENAPGTRDIQYHFAYALNENGQVKKAKQILDLILADDEPFSERSKAEELAASLK